MVIFQDAQTDSASLAKLVNEDTDVTTRYGAQPKKSIPKVVREFEEAGAESIAEFDQVIDQYKESRGFNTKGTFAAGFTYELPNDVGLDASGNPWILIDTSSLPVVVTAGTTPTNPPYKQVAYGTAAQVSTNTSDTAQSFIDSFALKVFQSPTEGLTEINTRTLLGGEVYEVRKISDGSFADIYTDKESLNPITQDGTSNVSGGDGAVEFYIADGDYYVVVGVSSANFKVNIAGAAYARSLSLADAINEDAPIGTIYNINGGQYKVVDAADTGGVYKTGLASGRKLKLLVTMGYYPVYAYVSDTTGATNIYSELLELVQAAKSQGIPLLSSPNDKYNVGGFLPSADLSKFIIDADGFTWATNGCEFIAQAQLGTYHDGRASQVIFEVEANGVNTGDVKVTADNIARDGSERQGIQAYWFNNSTRNTRRNKIGDVSGTKLISCIVATSSDPTNFRLRGLEHGNLFNDGGYYVLNCANNADGVEGSLSSNDCIRTYFCYGVTSHTEVINTYNHLKFSDVVIARFSRNTSDINLTYTCHGTATSSGVISFEHINDDADSAISNVTIRFGITVSNPANPSINFKSFTSSGVVESTTAKSFSEIRLSGKTNSTTALDLVTEIVGESDNSVYIERDEFLGQKDTKGFNFISGRQRLAFSNLAGGHELKFNISDLKFVPSYGKLSLFATNNAFQYTGEYIQKDYYIAFSQGGDGSVNILATDLISSNAAGTEPALLFPNQPSGSYRLVVDVNGYTGTDSIVKGFLDLQTGIAVY